MSTLNNFDNDYYSALMVRSGIDPQFHQEKQENKGDDFPDQYLWRRGDQPVFMLNVDMAIAVDFDGHIDPKSGEVTCNLEGKRSNRCPAALTEGIAMEFDQSNSRWIDAFHEAFMKMTTVGCNSSTCTVVA